MVRACVAYTTVSHCLHVQPSALVSNAKQSALGSYTEKQSALIRIQEQIVLSLIRMTNLIGSAVTPWFIREDGTQFGEQSWYVPS